MFINCYSPLPLSLHQSLPLSLPPSLLPSLSLPPPVSELFKSAPHLPQTQLEAGEQLDKYPRPGSKTAAVPKKHSLEETGTWKKKSVEKKRGKTKVFTSKVESGEGGKEGGGGGGGGEEEGGGGARRDGGRKRKWGERK